MTSDSSGVMSGPREPRRCRVSLLAGLSTPVSPPRHPLPLVAAAPAACSQTPVCALSPAAAPSWTGSQARPVFIVDICKPRGLTREPAVASEAIGWWDIYYHLVSLVRRSGSEAVSGCGHLSDTWLPSGTSCVRRGLAGCGHLSVHSCLQLCQARPSEDNRVAGLSTHGPCDGPGVSLAIISGSGGEWWRRSRGGYSWWFFLFSLRLVFGRR